MLSTDTSSITLKKDYLLPMEERLEVENKKKTFSIGILKELDEDENRTALAPHAVEMLVNEGHRVFVEKGSGEKANFSDLMYSELGGIISDNKKEIYQSDIIVKVSPPSWKEIDFFKKNQLLFSSYEIGRQSKEYIKKLQEKKITCFAYEFYTDKKIKTYPILQSMNEISGTSAVLIAAEYLSKAQNGKGEMLGGISGVSPSDIVILGADTAAEFAARTALGLGATVKVFDHSIEKLRNLQEKIGTRIFTSVLQPRVLEKALKYADVVIGALANKQGTNSFKVSEESIKKMKPSSVIIDLQVNFGGCFETTKITNFKNPVFNKYGVIHYCVPNIPSRVARTATYALSNILIQIITELAYSGSFSQQIKKHKGFANGIYLYRGVITKPQIAEKFNLSWKDIYLILDGFF